MHTCSLSTVLTALIVTLAAAAPSQAAEKQPLEVVDSVDLERYLGRWYEIASYPAWFQKNCTAVTADYSLRDDGVIEVINSCRKGTLDGKLKKSKGRAKVVDATTNAKLKVSFFGPFWGPYWIIDLDPDYQWAVIGMPSRKYLWILSRTPQMDEAVYDEIVAQLPSRGLRSGTTQSNIAARRRGYSMKRVLFRFRWFVMVAIVASMATAVYSSTEHPLEPPDRSSPRATLATFLDSIDEAWVLYQVKDPSVRDVFARARGCLDLSDVPPMVAHELSAKSALMLKEVLDRIEMPPQREIPDADEVAALGLKQWTIPHTEITLVQTVEGDRVGKWLFSTETVARANEFYEKVRGLPYLPGRLGGHIDELRSETDATLIARVVSVFPQSAKSEISGMLVWQWGALGFLVLMMVLLAAAAAWLGNRWSASRLPGARLGVYLFPLMLIAMPFFSQFLIRRIFLFPVDPALWVRLIFSVLGSVGLAWFVAVFLTRIGVFIANHGFRNARPLKKQFIGVMFRIATILVVTAIAVISLQRLGVPIAGLIAGVGVGGLAIALAAQSTLENFIGGIILYADQPVKVGDLCKFGNLRGIVEDVGLRSVKIRTLDRTIVTVPNADFAKLQLENLAERDRVLLRENLRLRYETTREQLQSVMSELESMLREHERIAEEPLRVRFTGFGEYFLEIELYAYAMTEAWPEFLEIREDVLFKVMEIVENDPAPGWRCRPRSTTRPQAESCGTPTTRRWGNRPEESMNRRRLRVLLAVVHRHSDAAVGLCSPLSEAVRSQRLAGHSFHRRVGCHQP